MDFEDTNALDAWVVDCNVEEPPNAVFVRRNDVAFHPASPQVVCDFAFRRHVDMGDDARVLLRRRFPVAFEHDEATEQEVAARAAFLFPQKHDAMRRYVALRLQRARATTDVVEGVVVEWTSDARRRHVARVTLADEIDCCVLFGCDVVARY